MSESVSPHSRYVAKLFPGSSHAWAISRLVNWKSQERILDIGIGSGVMGIELRNRGFNHLSGVEIDSDTRTKASTLGCYEVITETIQNPQIGDGYGHALLLDVLEHVADPAKLLKDVTSRLCLGGTILISVPNVTHWALRLMLLAGYFRYAERGPLDKTHLRFFSKFVLHELITEIPELEVGDIVGSIVPLELMLPQWLTSNPIFTWFRDFRIMLANEFPTIFGYQLLVEVKRRT